MPSANVAVAVAAKAGCCHTRRNVGQNARMPDYRAHAAQSHPFCRAPTPRLRKPVMNISVAGGVDTAHESAQMSGHRDEDECGHGEREIQSAGRAERLAALAKA